MDSRDILSVFTAKCCRPEVENSRGLMDDGDLIFPAHRVELAVPTLIAEAGPEATERFYEFFTATIRNANTRRAYARAAGRFFLSIRPNSLGTRLRNTGRIVLKRRRPS